MKKLYMTIESEQPLTTMDGLLNGVLEADPSVTYAEGRIGWSGSTEKRRYELEQQFQGVQPEDFTSKPKQTAPREKRKGRRRR